MSYYTAQEAQGGMSILAGWLGKNYKVNVRYHDGNAVDANIDTGTIRIPKLACASGVTEEALQLLRAMVYHESGHIAETKMEKKDTPPKGALFTILNAVEDRRIERALSDEHLGCKEIFRWANGYYNKKIAGQIAEQVIKGGKGAPLWEAMCAMSFMLEGVQPAWRLTPKAAAYVKAAYDEFSKVRQAESAYDCLAIAKKIQEILKETSDEFNKQNQKQKPQKPQKQEQDEKQGQKGGKSQKSDGNDSSQADDLDDEDGESEESDSGDSKESKKDSKKSDKSDDKDSKKSDKKDDKKSKGKGRDEEKDEEDSDEESDGSGKDKSDKKDSDKKSNSKGESDEDSDEEESDEESDGKGSKGDKDSDEDLDDESDGSGKGEDSDDEDSDDGAGSESDADDEDSGDDSDEGSEEGEGGKNKNLSADKKSKKSKAEKGEGKNDADGEDMPYEPDDSGIDDEETAGKQSKTNLDEEANGATQRDILNERLDELFDKLTESDKEYLALRDADKHLVPKETLNDRENFTERRNEIAAGVSAMTRALEQALRSMAKVKKDPYLRYGKIDKKRLVQITKSLSKEVFFKTRPGEDLNVAVEIVIDESGSMSNFRKVQQLAIAIGEALSQIGVKFEITGTTTEFCGGDYGMPLKGSFTRTNPIIYFHYKGFEENWITVRQRITQTSCRNHNVDGEAIEFAAYRLAQRKESRKIIFSLSDGEPCAGHNNDSFMCKNIKTVCARCRKNGIEVYGFGVQTQAPEAFYGRENFVYLKDIEQMGEDFVRKFATVITGGRVRV